MSSLPLKRRFFIQPANGQLTPVDMVIDGPVRFLGHKGKPLAPDHPPVYQAIAHFPGLLDADGFAARGWTTLEALIGVLNSVRQHWKDFDKAGGRIYGSLPDDEDKPDLSVQIKAKDFLS